MNKNKLEKFHKNLLQFGPFEDAPHFAVALSGGVDSMILLHLLMQIEINGQKPIITALTINHNLRAESGKEAKKTAEIVKNWPIEHHIIEWKHEKIESNIEHEARIARYELLTKFCLENNILHLFTAHNMNDVAENFLIRALRGSSSFGLSPMKDCISIAGVQIIRPLLDHSKDEIMQYANLYNLQWVEDPSNESDQFTRNRVRKFLKTETHAPSRLAMSSNNLNESVLFIQKIVDEALFKFCIISSLGFAEVSLDVFGISLNEAKFQIFSRILRIISGNPICPRYEKLKKALKNLQNDNSQTLHNCMLVKKQNKILIFKENKSQRILVQPGQSYFDQRWLVKSQFQCKISLFSQERYLDLSKIYDELRNFPHDKRILFSLPFIESQNEFAIPQIGLYSTNFPAKLLEIKFKPNWLIGN